MISYLDSSGLTYLWGKLKSTFQSKLASKGSSTKPIYVSASGTTSECSTYAGGTKVTLNGTDKGASTASLYAPTSAGTAKQVLVSSGGTPAWQTGELIHHLTSVSGTAAVTSNPYYATRWVGTLEGITALYTGLIICIRVPNSGDWTYGVVLNVNNLGEHPVCRLVNSTVGSGYPTGSMLTLIYDAAGSANVYRNSASSAAVSGVWKIADYDSTNTYQLKHNYGNYVAATAVGRYKLLLQKNETTLIPVNSVDNSTATTKTLTTEAFNPFGQILYYNSTNQVAANAEINVVNLYNQINLNLAYSFNTGSTLTAKKDVYIVAVPQSDGTAKLDSTPITQTLPTGDNGKIYIYLGHATNTSNIEMHVNHPVYWYKNGKIVPFTGSAFALASHAHSANDIVGGYLSTHPEGSTLVIPFINNDIAHLLKKGGSATIQVNGSTISTDLTNIFDGSPSYWGYSTVNLESIVIEITLHKTFAWSNKIYIDFGTTGWRAKGIVIEVINTSFTSDVWTQKYNNTNNGASYALVGVSHTPVGASNAGSGFNKVRFTLTSFQGTSNSFRISQIGIVNYGSFGAREVFLPKDGGAMYGSISPNTNNTLSLGSSDKKWGNVYATTVHGALDGNASTATKATQDGSGNNIENTYFKSTNFPAAITDVEMDAVLEEETE